MLPAFSFARPLLPIAGGNDNFPVRRVFCVGRNYAEHAREMGASGRQPPFFFCKPADAVVPVSADAVGQMAYPPRTADLQHEVELVIAVGRGGRDIAVADAAGHVFGQAIGFDMTRRDLQTAAKEKGLPWEVGKAFDQSAPIGPIHRIEQVPLLTQGEIGIDVNGEARQRGDVADMIWPVAEIIAELSGLFELAPGDLIFTGTPAGVGPVWRGDRMAGRIAGLGELDVTIV